MGDVFKLFGQYIFDPFCKSNFKSSCNFYKIFLFIKLPGAFGFAIIMLTIAVRLLFQPFFKSK